MLVDEPDGFEDQLIALQRAGLVRLRGNRADLGMEYVFISALIRDAAYESLLSTQRSSLHQQIADHMEVIFSKKAVPQRGCSSEYLATTAGVKSAPSSYALMVLCSAP